MILQDIYGLIGGLMTGTAQAVTFANDPTLGTVSPGTFLDGTVRLSLDGCSGALLWTGMHVLTAAHCAAGHSSGSATFSTPAGDMTIGGSNVTVNPNWDGKLNDGGDLAVLTLDSMAPVSGYQIYRATTLGRPTRIELAGYGRTGTGTSGSTLADGVLRAGSNTYDLMYDSIPGHPYLFDFDDGTSARDTLGNIANSGLSVHNLGTGDTEALVAGGDSGGPSFIQIGGQWQLAGIHSFIFSLGQPFDGNATPDDSSFGEVGGDTRLAFYAPWIDSVATAAVPEPGCWTLMGVGLIGLGAAARRTRRSQERPLEQTACPAIRTPSATSSTVFAT